jgi:hypothetical protein
VLPNILSFFLSLLYASVEQLRRLNVSAFSATGDAEAVQEKARVVDLQPGSALQSARDRFSRKTSSFYI